jgi:5-methylcytosine-specific restriction endonuclease McrA
MKMELVRCTTCKIEKDRSEFYSERRKTNGLSSRCKSCANKATVTSRKLSPANDAKSRAWREANKARLAEYTRQWRQDNAERVKRTQKAYRQREHVLFADHAAARRALHVGATVEDVERAVVWVRDQGICVLCRTPADPDNWHLEHLTPLSRGGAHSYANTAVSHPTCNVRKHDRTLDEWLHRPR